MITKRFLHASKAVEIKKAQMYLEIDFTKLDFRHSNRNKKDFYTPNKINNNNLCLEICKFQ